MQLIAEHIQQINQEITNYAVILETLQEYDHNSQILAEIEKNENKFTENPEY